MINSKITNNLSWILLLTCSLSLFLDNFFDSSDILLVICVVSGLGAAAINLPIVIGAIKEKRSAKNK